MSCISLEIYYLHIQVRRHSPRRNNEESVGMASIRVAMFSRGSCSWKKTYLSRSPDKGLFLLGSIFIPLACAVTSAHSPGILDEEEETPGQTRGDSYALFAAPGLREVAECPVEWGRCQVLEPLAAQPPSTPRASPRVPPACSCKRLCTSSSPLCAWCSIHYRWDDRS